MGAAGRRDQHSWDGIHRAPDRLWTRGRRFRVACLLAPQAASARHNQERCDDGIMQLGGCGHLQRRDALAHRSRPVDLRFGVSGRRRDLCRVLGADDHVSRPGCRGRRARRGRARHAPRRSADAHGRVYPQHVHQSVEYDSAPPRRGTHPGGNGLRQCETPRSSGLLWGDAPSRCARAPRTSSGGGIRDDGSRHVCGAPLQTCRSTGNSRSTSCGRGRDRRCLTVGHHHLVASTNGCCRRRTTTGSCLSKAG
jgi:hypothetical protein